MNRHYRRGFTRVMINDLYNVEPQLQEYDEHLYIMWNPHTGEHLIMDGLTELAIMKLPQPGWVVLTSDIVEHIRKIHTSNGFSATKVVERADEMIEREIEKKSDQLAHDFARDMYHADKKSVVMSGVGA